MNNDRYDSSGPATRDGRITVEAQYTLSRCEEQTTKHWTLEGVSPQQAKDKVVRDYIPSEATLWRVGLWYGSPEDRPESGHQDGILASEGGDTRPQDNKNQTLDQF